MSRKRYPKEFKIEAVKQVTEAGYSAYDVADVSRVNRVYWRVKRPNAAPLRAQYRASQGTFQ